MILLLFLTAAVSTVISFAIKIAHMIVVMSSVIQDPVLLAILVFKFNAIVPNKANEYHAKLQSELNFHAKNLASSYWTVVYINANKFATMDRVILVIL